MSDKGEFKQVLWEAQIPRYARVVDPFRQEFSLWAKTIGKLDRSKPTWVVVDEDSRLQKRLVGLAAKAAIVHGTPAHYFSATALGQTANKDFDTFRLDYSEYMLFIVQPEWLTEEENFGLINVYRYWKLMEWPIWFQSMMDPKRYLQQLPQEVKSTLDRVPETLRWYANDLKKRAQVLKAAEYV